MNYIDELSSDSYFNRTRRSSCHVSVNQHENNERFPFSLSLDSPLFTHYGCLSVFSLTFEPRVLSAAGQLTMNNQRLKSRKHITIGHVYGVIHARNHWRKANSFTTIYHLTEPVVSTAHCISARAVWNKWQAHWQQQRSKVFTDFFSSSSSYLASFSEE